MSSTQSHSHYLHSAQRNWIRQLKRRWYWRLELPTWGIMAAVYGGWFGVAQYWQALGPWLGTPLLILLTTWYMSLQHELIHGHPTRWPRVNQLFGLLPLAVWYPYGLYRDSHIQHHRNEHLTNPHEIPKAIISARPNGSVSHGCFRCWRRFAIRWSGGYCLARCWISPPRWPTH